MKMRWSASLTRALQRACGLLINFRKKSFNSAEWLERRKKDPYIERAKMENYRCRSAFKLMEIDDRYKFLKPGQVVIDIGAAPGSWTQVLVKRTNANGEDERKAKGFVIAVDRTPITPIESAEILSGMDFTKEKTRARILEVLDGRKLDFVLSDMAPNATGVKKLDADAIHSLVRNVLAFAVTNLRPGGGCLLKMWEGRHEDIASEMRRFFEEMNFVKPRASQKESSEIFLLGRRFRGLAKGPAVGS